MRSSHRSNIEDSRYANVGLDPFEGVFGRPSAEASRLSDERFDDPQITPVVGVLATDLVPLESGEKVGSSDQWRSPWRALGMQWGTNEAIQPSPGFQSLAESRG
jgi:hypothetical protein